MAKKGKFVFLVNERLTAKRPCNRAKRKASDFGDFRGLERPDPGFDAGKDIQFGVPIRPGDLQTFVREEGLPALFRRDDGLGLPIHRDMSRLSRYAIEPGADFRKGGEVVIAFVREMGICIKRDVGDRIVIGDEVAMMREVMLHHRK